MGLIRTVDCVDIICPHCEEYIEYLDIDVSVCVMGADVSRKITDGETLMRCEHCDLPIRLYADLVIDVDAIIIEKEKDDD